MGRLPDLPYSLSRSRRRSAQISFGKLNRTPTAGDGDIWDECNITTDHYPALSLRRARYYKSMGIQHGTVGSDTRALFWNNGPYFYYDGVLVDGMLLPLPGEVERSYVTLGNRIIIMPDKYFYDSSDGTYGSLEAVYNPPSAVSVRLSESSNGDQLLVIMEKGDDGLWHDAAAPTYPFEGFSADDTVYISFETLDLSAYNGYYTLTGASHYALGFVALTFPEEIFSKYDHIPISRIERLVPDMDYMCSVNNHLFGCRGSEIYISAKGDPFNWTPSADTALGATVCPTGSHEAFTACAVYNSRPVFFTETRAFTVYGDEPLTFSTVETRVFGVKEGAWKTVVAFDGYLLYLSRYGVVRYTSSGTEIISDELGVRMITGAAGGDGLHYFLSVNTGAEYVNYVFNVRTGLWSKEDCTEFYSFARLSHGLYGAAELYAANGSSIGQAIYYVSGDAPGAPADGFVVDSPTSCAIELAPFREDHSAAVFGQKKWAQALIVRVQAGMAVMRVKLIFDAGDETLAHVESFGAEGESQIKIPLPNNRCDRYRVRLEADVGISSVFRLLGMAREYTIFN